MSKKELHKTRNFIMINIGLILVSIGFNLFLEPLHIVIGESGGIAIILESLFKISPSITIFVIYAVMFVISLIFLEKKDVINSLYGTIAFPFFIELFKDIDSYILIEYTNLLLACVFGGVLTGLGYGLIYRADATTGGTDVIVQLTEKYLGTSMGTAGLLSNGVIITVGVYVFGIVNLFYAAVIIYIISVVTDRVVLGIHDHKTCTIITTKEEDIKKFVYDVMHYNITVMDGSGGHSKEPKKVIMCVIPTTDYFRLKEGIQMIDKDAFLLVSDSYEIRHRKKRLV